MNLFEPVPEPLLPHDPDGGPGAVDPLTALAVLDPTELRVRPVAEIEARAGRLRGVRRTRTAVLAAAASVAVVTVVATVLPSGGTATLPADGPTPTASASQNAPGPTDGCDPGWVTPVADVAPLVHLVAGATPAPLAVVDAAALGGPECYPDEVPTAAVVARLAGDGRVSAGLVVSGPSAQPPLPDLAGVQPSGTVTSRPSGTSAPDPGLELRTVTVHGARGMLRREADTTTTPVAVAGTGKVQWREPATGAWWLVESSGLSSEELLSVAERLGTSGATLDATTVPGAADGWTALPFRARRLAGHRFEAGYEDTSGPSVTLWASDVQEPGPEVVGQVSAAALRVGDVNGARALLRPIGTEGDSPSLVWSAGGVHFTLFGSPDLDFEDLLALARRVEQVPVDDPRVLRAAAPLPTSAPTTSPTSVPVAPTSAPTPTGTVIGAATPAPPTTTAG